MHGRVARRRRRAAARPPRCVPLLEASMRTFAELLAEHGEELRAAVHRPRRTGAGAAAAARGTAELGADADRALLAALGADAEVLDSGCIQLAREARL